MIHESDLTPINPESLGNPKGYSNGMLARPGGRMLFIAGQIAWDQDQNIVCEDFRGQFASALNNVVTVVRAAGGFPENIAQLTIFVTDKNEYLQSLDELGETYRLVMGRHFPTMALVEVSALVEPQAKVEIQGLAMVYPQEEAVIESTGSSETVSPPGSNITEFPPTISKKGA